MPFISPYKGTTPRIDDSVYIAPGAVVVGDVVCGKDSSIWYNVVIRGDVGHVHIGERVNVQDLSMIHMSEGMSNAEIGDDVTIGHRAIIHGARIEDRVLIGMGAIILDNAVIGEDSIVGANALVTKNTDIPPRSLVLGAPAKVVRELTDEEVASLPKSAAHYVEIAGSHSELSEAESE
jgi:carbonic anhydrase/acetyltransferase-like protein (isoleucine patch superfamily)